MRCLRAFFQEMHEKGVRATDCKRPITKHHDPILNCCLQEIACPYIIDCGFVAQYHHIKSFRLWCRERQQLNVAMSG